MQEAAVWAVLLRLDPEPEPVAAAGKTIAVSDAVRWSSSGCWPQGQEDPRTPRSSAPRMQKAPKRRWRCSSTMPRAPEPAPPWRMARRPRQSRMGRWSPRGKQPPSSAMGEARRSRLLSRRARRRQPQPTHRTASWQPEGDPCAKRRSAIPATLARRRVAGAVSARRRRTRARPVPANSGDPRRAASSAATARAASAAGSVHASLCVPRG